MNRKWPAFLLLGATVVLIFGLYALLHHGHKPAHHPVKTAAVKKKAKPPPPKVFVVGMGPPAAAGTLLQPGEIVRVPAKDGKVAPGQIRYTPKAVAAFYGAMLRRQAAPQTPLTNAMVIKPGQSGFLAAVLKPGMRAMTIPVDRISDSSGLIWPGDRVDVMLVQSLPQQIQTGHNLAAETVLGNVEVIAAGSTLVAPTGPKSNGTVPVSTVTLEVTPDQAKKLALDEHLGALSLTLLSAQSDSRTADLHGAGAARRTADPAGLTWAYQASPALTASDSNNVTVFSVNSQQGYVVP